MGSIADFLQSITVLKDQETKSFLSNQGISPIFLNQPSDLLFHGSITLSEELVPGDQEQKVYATDNPTYAIFLAIIDIQEGGSASVVMQRKKAKLALNSGFINGTSKLTNGYIHVVQKAGFKDLPNSEFSSEKAVPVVFAIKVFPKDLVTPIHISDSF